MPKNAAKLVVWRGFWVKLRAQRRSKIAAHELISVALGSFFYQISFYYLLFV